MRLSPYKIAVGAPAKASRVITHNLSQVRYVFLGLLGLVFLSILIIGATVYSISPSVTNFLARQRAEVVYFSLYKFPYKVLSSHVTVNNNPKNVSTAAAIPVLLYHGEGSASDMPLGKFVDQLRSLKTDGWQTITVEQLQDFMKKGKTLPQKSFLLTFDDGRKDTFYNSDPVLKDLGYTGVMFVITGFSLPQEEKRLSTYYLSKAELQYMSDSGRWELESHGDQDHGLFVVPTSDSNSQTDTQGHFLSNFFWLSDQNRLETDAEYKERVTNDLAISKSILETDFGKPVIGFAYPFNDFGQDTVNNASAQGVLGATVSSVYTFAFRQVNLGKDEILNYPDPENYVIKRIEPQASWSGADLVKILDAAAPKELPFSENQFGGEWVQSWGKVTSQDTFTLSAAEDTSGATSFLVGSQEWKNYHMSATIDWERGQDVSLLARYHDATRSYLSCTFGDNQIYIETHEGTSQETVGHTPYTRTTDKSSTLLSLSVSGSRITCSADGSSVSASIFDSKYQTGGVGISVWDPVLGTASISVKKVIAEAL